MGAQASRATKAKRSSFPSHCPTRSVEARITQDQGSYANAELEKILEASPQRAEPPCSYFSECGGCHYQHANYREQVEIKSQILRETLERAHLAHIPEITTLCAEPLAYRNRIRLHIDPSTDRLGYKQRSSHHNLPVEECPIAAPILQHALKAIQSAAPELHLATRFSEIELFTNSAQDSMLAALWSGGDSRSAPQQLQPLWQELKGRLPQITGAAVFSIEERRQPSRLIAQIGEPSLTYTAFNHQYRVTLGSFFQVNRFLIDPLVDLVTKEHSGRLAWDLYAGVGLFSAALASRFDQVVAVESSHGSVRDLRHNLQGKQHRVVSSSTLDFLRRALPRKEAVPDFVLVDPPRAGSGKEVTTVLAGRSSCPHYLRFLRSGNSVPRSRIAARLRLSPHSHAHGRSVSADLPS